MNKINSSIFKKVKENVKPLPGHPKNKCNIIITDRGIKDCEDVIKSACPKDSSLVKAFDKRKKKNPFGYANDMICGFKINKLQCTKGDPIGQNAPEVYTDIRGNSDGICAFWNDMKVGQNKSTGLKYNCKNTVAGPCPGPEPPILPNGRPIPSPGWLSAPYYGCILPNTKFIVNCDWKEPKNDNDKEKNKETCKTLINNNKDWKVAPGCDKLNPWRRYKAK